MRFSWVVTLCHSSAMRFTKHNNKNIYTHTTRYTCTTYMYNIDTLHITMYIYATYTTCTLHSKHKYTNAMYNACRTYNMYMLCALHITHVRYIQCTVSMSSIYNVRLVYIMRYDEMNKASRERPWHSLCNRKCSLIPVYRSRYTLSNQLLILLA